MNPLRKKFVVLKGAAGFGDRLQCLLQAIWYAESTDRCLVVDWRDEEWSGSAEESSETFLQIGNLETCTTRDFLTLYRRVGWDLTLAPKAWEPIMFKSRFRDHLYQTPYNALNGEKQFHRISTFEIEDFNEDVVIYCGTGFRGFRYSDFNRISLHPMLSLYLRTTLAEFNLKHQGYDIVHLRALSKKWAGGEVKLKSHAEKIDAAFPARREYVASMLTKWRNANAAQDRATLPTFIISDSSELAQEWIALAGQGRFIPHSMQTARIGSGIHESTDEQLRKGGSNRARLNAETLRDFALMLGARHIIGDGLSLFSEMAGRCAAFANQTWRIDQA